MDFARSRFAWTLTLFAFAAGCDDPTLQDDEAGSDAGSRGNVSGSSIATPGETDAESIMPPTPGETDPDGNDSSNDTGGL